jgi:hypothetical protein
MTILTETRERFLRAILAQVPAERIAEIHFFHPIKQGGVESGVAVVAAWAEPSGPVSHPEGVEATPTSHPEGAAATEGSLSSQGSSAPTREPRPVVYTALYRLTLKGLDRGKWETNVVAEADAPLVSVEAVVRGVQRRAGDVDDPVRMDGDDVRAFIDARQPVGNPITP